MGMKKTIKGISCTVAALALLGMAQPKTAESTVISTWTWGAPTDTIDGIQQGGSVTFSTGGAGELVITLSNTGPNAATKNRYILAGLFFDLSTGGALTMESAYATGGLLSSESQTIADSGTTGTSTNICNTGTGTVVVASGCSASLAGGWEAAYSATGFSSLNSLVTAGNWGIGTTGIGIFNGNATHGTGDANYGIAPSGVGTGVDASNLASGSFPYVYGTATFTFSGYTAGATISDVFASYGTQPEGFFAGVIDGNPPDNNPPTNDPPTTTPEPASVMTLAGGGLLLLFARRRAAR
jgi:hypothetical protein